MKIIFPHKEAGSAAMEYIVVSVFGLLFALASIAFVGKVAKQKLASIEQKLGIQIELEEFNPF